VRQELPASGAGSGLLPPMVPIAGQGEPRPNCTQALADGWQAQRARGLGKGSIVSAPTNNRPFNNPSSHAERVALLKAEAERILQQQNRNINTRSALTEVISPSAGGRFARAAVEQTNNASRSDPSQLYPQMPEGNPWRSDPVGLEPPFPGDISYVEPCGTLEEIERSLSALAEPVAVSPAAAADPSVIADQEPTGPLPTHHRLQIARAGSGSSFPRRRFV
jgi:hypothetical protein